MVGVFFIKRFIYCETELILTFCNHPGSLVITKRNQTEITVSNIFLKKRESIRKETFVSLCIFSFILLCFVKAGTVWTKKNVGQRKM